MQSSSCTLALMRIVVAGAGGFVGAATVRELLSRGHSVAVLARDGKVGSRLEAIGVTKISVADGFPVDEITRALSGFSADVFLSLAWNGVANFERNEQYQFANIEMYERLSRAALEAGTAHFVGIGSQAEYGPTEGIVGEDTALLPTTYYGCAKASAGLVSRATLLGSHTSFSWLRLFSIYGPGDAPHWMVQSIGKKLVRGEDAELTPGTQLWDYLYVDDAARAIADVAETASGVGFANLGSGQAFSLRSIVELMKQIVDSKSQLKFGSVPFREDQVMHLQADVTKISSMTGWRPLVPIEAGLEHTLIAIEAEEGK